jgi:hypothetical protein
MADEEYSTSERKSFHRAMHHLNHGGLHRALGVAEGSPIPTEKLEHAKSSTNAHVRAMAVLADNMKHWHHGSK